MYTIIPGSVGYVVKLLQNATSSGLGSLYYALETFHRDWLGGHVYELGRAERYRLPSSVRAWLRSVQASTRLGWEEDSKSYHNYQLGLIPHGGESEFWHCHSHCFLTEMAVCWLVATYSENCSSFMFWIMERTYLDPSKVLVTQSLFTVAPSGWRQRWGHSYTSYIWWSVQFSPLLDL